ncbi:MAG: hypothetical protein H0W74_11850 [Sphingosinicella sp.]|nr:hypothetical protein [Sphingosinicella sp.]
MSKRQLISIAMIACIALGTPAGAVSSSTKYKMNVAGSAMTCTSATGKPVQLVSNASMATLGRASLDRNGDPVIEIHPGALAAYSPFIQQWWFAHECAHHQLSARQNSESRADCYAAKSIRKLASGTVQEARAITRELGSLSASNLGHLPGNERANLVLKCAGLNTVV